MSSREALLRGSMESFYSGNLPFLRYVSDITSGRNNTISLRILDWLVTSYAKRHNVVIMRRESIVHLHTSYKNFLSSHSKKMFDAFRRRQRVHIDEAGFISMQVPEEPFLVTTVGQLVFFHWCFFNGVIDYAMANIREIERDLKHFQPGKETSTSAVAVNHHVTVEFE
jgi:hypothetical protein